MATKCLVNFCWCLEDEFYLLVRSIEEDLLQGEDHLLVDHPTGGLLLGASEEVLHPIEDRDHQPEEREHRHHEAGAPVLRGGDLPLHLQRGGGHHLVHLPQRDHPQRGGPQARAQAGALAQAGAPPLQIENDGDDSD